MPPSFKRWWVWGQPICQRYVDKDLDLHEEFVSFHAVFGTTGSMLATCFNDCFIRYQLPIENLRGQTCDGASNISGQYNGCQAIIPCDQLPLAAYVQCVAHCTNLVATTVSSSSVNTADSGRGTANVQ